MHTALRRLARDLGTRLAHTGFRAILGLFLVASRLRPWNSRWFAAPQQFRIILAGPVDLTISSPTITSSSGPRSRTGVETANNESEARLGLGCGARAHAPGTIRPFSACRIMAPYR